MDSVPFHFLLDDGEWSPLAVQYALPDGDVPTDTDSKHASFDYAHFKDSTPRLRWRPRPRRKPKPEVMVYHDSFPLPDIPKFPYAHGCDGGLNEDSADPDDAKFIDDLGADSLDTVELVMAFEEAFDVEIPDEKAETILTVGDAIAHLEAK